MTVLRQQAPNPADPIERAKAAGVDSGEEGVLATVGRFLSRPAYIARNLLRGHPLDALANAAQFSLDLPTAGWLNPNWSLANLFTDTGDVTTKEQRPEFTDLVGKTGNAVGDAALDVVGGILTDPLTYLPFAGEAKAALAAESGTRALAASRLAGGLAETARGAELSAAAGRDVLAEISAKAGAGGRGPLAGRALTPEWLGSEEATRALGPEVASSLRRTVETRTAERVLRGAVSESRSATATAARTFRGVADAKYLDAMASEFTPEKVAEARAALAEGLELPFGIERAKEATPTGAAAWRAARGEALKETGFDETGAFMRFGTTALGRDPVLAGLRALEEGGATVPDGALTFRIPFDPRPVGAGGALAPRVLTGPGAFGRATRALIPGKLISDVLAGGKLPGAPAQRLAIDLRRFTDERATRLYEWAKSELVEKGLPVGAEAALGQAARDAKTASGNLGARTLAAGASKIASALEGLSSEQAKALGRSWLTAGDHMETILQAGEDASALRPLENQLDDAIRALPGQPPAAVPALAPAEGTTQLWPGGPVIARRAVQAVPPAHVLPELATGVPRLPEPLLRGYGPNQRRVIEKLALVSQEQAVADGLAAGVPRDTTHRAMSAYVASMGEIADDLVRLGVWDEKRPNPFYAPFQATRDVAGFLARRPDKAVGQAVLDVFTQAKESRTSPEFMAKLEKIAAEHGVNAPEGVMETNLAELWARRLAAHADTVERLDLQGSLRKRFPGVQYAEPVEKYLSRQFAEVGPRENGLSVILGGGKVLTRIPGAKLTDAEPAALIARGMRVVPHPAGGLAVESRWEGLNYYAKAFLTLPFPSFHVRNAVSNAVSAAIDPGMGPAVAVQVLGALRDAPILRALVGKRTPDVASLIARAVRDPDSLGAAEHAILEAATVGKHPALEVARLAREGVAGKTFPNSEVFEAPGRLARLAAAASPADLAVLEHVLQGKATVSANATLLERLGAAVSRVRNPSPEASAAALGGAAHAGVQAARTELMRAPGAVGSWVEDSARIAAFVALVEKGVDPIKAQQTVSRVLLDYSMQSTTERAIRDMIPFARYSIASVPVTLQNTARAPGGLIAGTIRNVVNRQDPAAFLPGSLRGQTAIQVGTDKEGNPIYAGASGLPYDAAADALGIVGRPLSGGPLRAAAGLQPQVRALAEGVLDKSFFFGTPPLSYRAAPRILPDALTTVSTTPDGREIRTVPGWVNHWLLGAGPLSRFRSESDKFLDPRLEPGAKALDLGTGVRLQSVDQRAEAKRAIMRWLEEAEARGDVRQVEAFFQTGATDDRLKAAIGALDALNRQGGKNGSGRRPAPGVR